MSSATKPKIRAYVLAMSIVDNPFVHFSKALISAPYNSNTT